MALLCPASYASAIVLEDGRVAVFGDWGALPSMQPVPLGECWDGEHVLEARALAVVVGECHGVLVSEDLQLFSWGQGSCGALGHAHFEDVEHPTRVRGRLEHEEVVMAVPGYSHVVALTRRGQVWVWGTSFNGELGTGPMQETRPEPVLLASFGSTQIETICCGCTHSLAVDVKGRCWAWGENSSGALGLGDTISRSEPTLMVEGKLASQRHRVVFLACSTRNSAAITNNNKLWVWGDGSFGKLPDSVDQLTPARVCNPGLECVLAVSLHEYVIIALSQSAPETTSYLMVWGGVVEASSTSDRAPRQLLPAPLPLGVGDRLGRRTPTKITGALAPVSVCAVSCGKLHMAALSAHGALYTWGVGGAHGHGHMADILEPMALEGLPQKAGRCRRLCAAQRLAFAMATHDRLADTSPARGLLPELVARILEAADTWPRVRGRPLELPFSMQRLMGAMEDAASFQRRRDQEWQRATFLWGSRRGDAAHLPESHEGGRGECEGEVQRGGGDAGERGEVPSASLRGQGADDSCRGGGVGQGEGGESKDVAAQSLERLARLLRSSEAAPSRAGASPGQAGKGGSGGRAGESLGPGTCALPTLRTQEGLHYTQQVVQAGGSGGRGQHWQVGDDEAVLKFSAWPSKD